MTRLEKAELFDRVINAVREAGWNVLYLNPRPAAHPFRLKFFRDDESYLIRIYIWNLTHGGGPARPADEYRIQVTGIRPQQFLPEPEGKTLILGWREDLGVFVGYDYRRHTRPLVRGIPVAAGPRVCAL